MHELNRLLLASVFTLSIGTLASSASADQQKVGVAGAVNPATNATPEGGSTAILNIGNDVSFHELIKTDTGGQAQLLFLDRSALTVGPNASLTIDEFVYNPDTKEGKLAINAAVGVFRFVGGQLSKSGDVTLKTPVATIGIRGAVAVFNVTPTNFSASLLFGQHLTIMPNFIPGGGFPGGQPGGQPGGAPGAPAGGNGNAPQPVILTPGNTVTISGTGQINIVPTTPVTISTAIKSFEPTQSSSGNQQLNVNSNTVNQTIQNSGGGFSTPSQVINTPGAVVTTVAAVTGTPSATAATQSVIPNIPTIITKATVATVASPPPPPVVKSPPPPPVIVAPPPPPVIVAPPPPPAVSPPPPPAVSPPPPPVVSPPASPPPPPPPNVPQSPPHVTPPTPPTPPSRPN